MSLSDKFPKLLSGFGWRKYARDSEKRYSSGSAKRSHIQKQIVLSANLLSVHVLVMASGAAALTGDSRYPFRKRTELCLRVPVSVHCLKSTLSYSEAKPLFKGKEVSIVEVPGPDTRMILYLFGRNQRKLMRAF